MLNTLVIMAFIAFIAFAILIEHRLNLRRREDSKLTGFNDLDDSKLNSKDPTSMELDSTDTARIQAQAMLEQTKSHEGTEDTSANFSATSAIKGTVVEQNIDESPLPDPFAEKDEPTTNS